MLCSRKHDKDTPRKNSPVAICRYRSVFVGMCGRMSAKSRYPELTNGRLPEYLLMADDYFMYLPFIFVIHIS